MVTIKYDLMNALEVAMNSCTDWLQNCEGCSNLQACVNSWPVGASRSEDDCLTSKELERYAGKFVKFMNMRSEECRAFRSD
jgi:hypothetical protein